jgi:hypothetical protein
MVNSSDEYFYNNVINTSSDESNNYSEILMAMAFHVHDKEQVTRGHLDNVHGYGLRVSGKSGALVVSSICQTNKAYPTG